MLNVMSQIINKLYIILTTMIINLSKVGPTLAPRKIIQYKPYLHFINNVFPHSASVP